MELQIISKEIAEKLKRLRFDQKQALKYYYRDDITDTALLSHLINYREATMAAPTQALVCKWFRDVHDIYINITRIDTLTSQCAFNINTTNNATRPMSKLYNTWEQAEEAGILKAIEILKQRNNEQ